MSRRVMGHLRLWSLCLVAVEYQRIGVEDYYAQQLFETEELVPCSRKN